jgi:serine/threonine-protein kinase
MKCPQCRSENPADTFFCGKCGTKLEESAAGKPVVSVTWTIETTTGELTRGTTFAGRYEIIEEL